MSSAVDLFTSPQRTHYSRAFLYAIAVHILALLLVVFSLRFEALYKPKPASHREVIQAVAVDRSVLEKELNRARAAEQQKHEEERQKKIEQQRQEAEKAQEHRQAEEKDRMEKEKQQALAEQERKLEQEKKRLEQERKREQEKKRLAAQREQEKKRLEEKKRKQEEQQRREKAERKQEEQKRQQEEARKKALLSELAAEEAEQQQQADAERVNDAIARISAKLARYFNKTGLPSGLVCKVRVRTVPSGDVVSAQVVESSGNPMFDRQCEIATQKGSPLPVPPEQRLFETYFREVDIRFNPWE